MTQQFQNFHSTTKSKSLQTGKNHTSLHPDTSLKLPSLVHFLAGVLFVRRARARLTAGPSDWTESQLATEH